MKNFSWPILAILAAVIWYFTRNKVLATAPLHIPVAQPDQLCSDTIRTPWINSPKKEAFLQFVKTQVTDPIAPIERSKMCQMWQQFSAPKA